MTARKRVALLATYVVAAGAVLATAPGQAVADTTCYVGWIECLEGLSQNPCSPGKIGYCDTGSPCETNRYRIVCGGGDE